MVRPKKFGFNYETANSNAFQNELEIEGLGDLVNEVFENVVDVFIANNIDVKVFDDLKGLSPDAIFPNNWVSQMPDGTVTLFPMATSLRQTEVQDDIIQYLLEKEGGNCLIDLRTEAEIGQYLEGTGSIVYDYDNKIAYACVSDRTNVTLFESYCKMIGYTPFSFESVDLKGKQIYHTNVIMAITEHYVIVNIESVENTLERLMLKKELEKSGKMIIEIDHQQTKSFAGNVMEVKNQNGDSILVMSQTAHQSLKEEQLEKITYFNKILVLDVSIIEKIGGGGVRCMLVGLFDRI